MSEMPMFDPVENDTPAPPKKPRQKPTRKRKARKAAAPVPKRRGRKKRSVGKHPALAAPYKKDQHAGGRYSRDVYAAIATLVGMKGSELDAVLDIVKGLTNGPGNA